MTAQSTTTGASIEADKITVGYGNGRPVLDELSVFTYPGRMLAVTGPSGIGKTTLLWTLAGLIKPKSGAVRIDGEPLTGHDQAIKRGVSLIPQNNGLAATLTASENVHIALIANGIPADEAEHRTAQALEQLGLTDQADQLVEELSGGQQQRTAVARGLAMRSRILLADEVTSELDAANREKVLELLLAECRRGAAVIFATHDPQAAEVCHAEVQLGSAHH
jgi:putative ABC transport system ATP-binding protein